MTPTCKPLSWSFCGTLGHDAFLRGIGGTSSPLAASETIDLALIDCLMSGEQGIR